MRKNAEKNMNIIIILRTIDLKYPDRLIAKNHSPQLKGMASDRLHFSMLNIPYCKTNVKKGRRGCFCILRGRSQTQKTARLQG